MAVTAPTEKRAYFRLDDSNYLEYRPCTEEEVQTFRDGGYRIAGRADDYQLQLDFIGRQITPLLNGIREDEPEIAQFLEGLNRKIDLIANQLFFEQFSAHTEQNLVSTRTSNISEYGLGITTEQPFEVGEFIFCRLVIANFRAGIETFAEIMHCRQLDVGRYHVGLKMPWVLESDRKQLVRYIMSCQREYRRKLAENKKNQQASESA